MVDRLIFGQNTDVDAAAEVIVGGDNPIKAIVVKAMSTNTGIIYVGLSTVLTTTGFELEAGESIMFECDNLSQVYVIASIANQKVCYVGIN